MNNIKGFFTVIKEVKYVLDRRQRRQAIGLFLLLFCSSIFELLGVSAVVPFIQSILTPEQLLENDVIRFFWDQLGLTSLNSLVILTGVGLIILYIVKNAFLIFASYIRLSCTMQWQKDISIRMLRSYMIRPYSFFLKTNSADIQRGCTGNVDNLNSTVNELFVLATEFITVLVIGIYLFYTDAFTAAGALALVAVIFIGIMYFLKPRVKKAGRMFNRAIIAINKSIIQTVQGIKEIMVMQRKDYFVHDYEQKADRYRISNRAYNIAGMLPDRITEGLCVSGVIGIVLIRLMIGGESMASFIPKLAAFAMASIKVLPSVGKISNCLNNIVFFRPGVDHLYTSIQEAERIERELGLYSENGDRIDGKNQKLLNHIVDSDFTVRMEHVMFRYEESESVVLNDLSINISKGESVGIVGSSGGGKTTTIDVMLGLLKPEKGSVTISGYDIHEIPRVWSKIVAYVPQTIFLLDDTVRENILFGKRNAGDELVWEALEQAQLRSFVESLPQGLDTVVGEQGVRFSGGQRQRIAIARAMINKPQILVLDEATAALDNETENAVIESVEALQGEVTLIIVAHRLTTIRNCDRVYEIKNGVATEVFDF